MTKKDVLTFGETMLRLTPPGRLRLDQAAAFDVWVAGSESNVAAALFSLGLSATWVSRLPDTALGHNVAAVLRARGVDVSDVVWTDPDERLGLFYAEPAAPPRPASVVYDRARSAAAGLAPADLPDALFDAHRHLHVTGITPALSPSCAEAVAESVRRARQRGLSVSLDVNYRAKLWPPETAAAALASLAEQVEILLCGREDAARLFGVAGDAAEQAAGLRARFGMSVAVVTAGGEGAAGADGDGTQTVTAFPVETTVDRFGSGDAFAAGFLAAHLDGRSLRDALRLGAAAGALKRTIPGDLLIATRADVEAVMTTEDTQWR